MMDQQAPAFVQDAIAKSLGVESLSPVGEVAQLTEAQVAAMETDEPIPPTQPSQRVVAPLSERVPPIDAESTEGAVTDTNPEKPKKTSKSRTHRSYPQGQSGPRLRLEPENLNDKERKVLTTLCVSDEPLTIDALANCAWPRKSQAQRRSWVRNSLRKLARGGLVLHARGVMLEGSARIRATYRASARGKKLVA